MDTFPNLQYLSRDRGKQYQNLSSAYIHVADRFHILKNLSDNLIKQLRKVIPNRVIIETASQADKAEQQNFKIAKKPDDNTQRTVAHKNIILEAYNTYGMVTQVHQHLLEKGIAVKYNSLNRFINKYKEKYTPQVDKENAIKITTTIKRRDIINEVFEWRTTEESLQEHMEELKNRYPIITKYQSFYQTFKCALTSLNFEKISKIFITDYTDDTINSFLKNAKEDDYEAIVNGAKYKINNGILEGTVNKIKNIKKIMYGRCSIELLTKKVLYQSINYH